MNHRNERHVRQERALPISNIRKSITCFELNEDHKLAAAGHGAVIYVIPNPSNSGHSKVGMRRTVQNDFISCHYGQSFPGHFRSTSPPFVSDTGKLYLGVKMLSDNKPAVLVWKPELHFFGSLQSDRRAHVITEWEYTFLTHSSTGSVLYCGCSDGTIEVWNRHVDPNHLRVYDRLLTTHVDDRPRGRPVGRISSLAVGQDGILLSVDKENSNIVRVWRSLNQVAKLDLGHEKVHRMACTPEKSLYVVTKIRGTEGGSKLWCDLRRVLAHVDHSTLDRHTPVFGMEYFSLLQQPNRGFTKARSCLAVGGASESTCFLCSPTPNHNTYCIEEWRGNLFVSRVDTGLKNFQAWTVSRHGTVYCSLRSTAHR